jgi:uncharacterized protein (TIGR03663 family)
MRFVWVWGLVAFLVRILQLELRPVHHDEACNSWFVDRIFEAGFFTYDPSNYHGPFYFYVLAVFRFLFGDTLFSLRLPSVIAGTLLTLSPLLFRRFFSRNTLWLACAFFAVSPALVVYSRDAIHEVMFALLSVVAVWRWWEFRESPSRTNALWLGLATGLWISTKETFVVLGFALLMAEILLRRGRSLKPLLLHLHWVLLAAVLPWFLLFTGGGQRPLDALKFFEAFVIWGKRSMLPEGNGKPFYYFLTTLFKAETVAFLFLILSWGRVKKPRSHVQEMWFIGAMSLLIYSLMNYKMPWCVVAFLPFIFLSGSSWLTEQIAAKSFRVQIAIPTLLLSVSILQIFPPTFLRVDDETLPYVYAQTYSEFTQEVRHVTELGPGVPLYILSNTTWPLPYLLRHHKNVNYASASASVSAPPETAMVLMIDEPLMRQVAITRVPIRQVTVKVRPWAPPMVFTYFQGNP